MSEVTDSPSPHPEMLAHLGPLAALVGIWEGAEGVDISPAKDGSKETHFRERMTFEPIGPVVNGPQTLYGLRYSTIAWPLIQEQPFHEEVGYWLWDAERTQVMRCFIVPRGVVVNAGGTSEPERQRILHGSRRRIRVCTAFSPIRFWRKGAKTVRYELSSHDSRTLEI